MENKKISEEMTGNCFIWNNAYEKNLLLMAPILNYTTTINSKVLKLKYVGSFGDQVG